VSRAEHLTQVQVPMLFLQGTRDEFAQLDLLTGVCEKLGPRATLCLIDDANHSFKVPKRSGSADQVMARLADQIVTWAGLLETQPR
jgi:predicted alpha/beta-hydrolase family hydrolase